MSLGITGKVITLKLMMCQLLRMRWIWEALYKVSEKLMLAAVINKRGIETDLFK